MSPPNVKPGMNCTCQTSDYDEVTGTGFKTDPCTIDSYGYSVDASCPYPDESGRFRVYGFGTIDFNMSECQDIISSSINMMCQTADYDAASGTGAQKNFTTCLHGYMDYNMSSGMMDVQRPVGYDSDSGLTFVNCTATEWRYFELATCEGTVETRVGRLDTCTGRRVKDVNSTLLGHREIDVEFATCEGTQDVPVACTFISSSSLNARR